MAFGPSGLKKEQQLNAQEVTSHLKPFVEQGLLSKWVIPTQVATVTKIPKISVGKLDKKRIFQDCAQWQTDALVFLSTL